MTRNRISLLILLGVSCTSPAAPPPPPVEELVVVFEGYVPYVAADSIDFLGLVTRATTGVGVAVPGAAVQYRVDQGLLAYDPFTTPVTASLQFTADGDGRGAAYWTLPKPRVAPAHFSACATSGTANVCNLRIVFTYP